MREGGNFLLRRLGRIYPLHAFMLAILIAAQFGMMGLEHFADVASPKPVFTEQWDPRQIPVHVFLLQSYGFSREGSWNYASWSIAAEFWSYVVFAGIVIFAGQKIRFWLFGLISAISLLVVLWFSPTKMDATFDYGLFRCSGGFFLGAIGQRVFKSARITLVASAWTFLEMMAILAATAAVVAFGRDPWGVTMPLVFVVVVFVFAHERGAVSRLLKTKPMASLGLWSYSLYMVQPIYTLILLRNIPRLLDRKWPGQFITHITYAGEPRDLLGVGGPWVCDVITIVYLIVLIATSKLTYEYIEVPCRKRIYSWIDARAARGR